MVESRYHSRCLEENGVLLHKLVDARHRLAKLHRFQSHREFAIRRETLSSVADVDDFLAELAEAIRTPLEKAKAELLRLKQKDCEDAAKPYDGVLHSWDVHYYSSLKSSREERFDADDKCFNFGAVTAALMGLYQRAFGLTFMEIPRPYSWADAVRMFRVLDEKTKDTLGYFYLDLIMRPGTGFTDLRAVVLSLTQMQGSQDR